jgi:hypothetical protein
MAVVEYELWDMESGNRLGAFATREEALMLVREMLEHDGPSAVESLGLGSLHQTADGDDELHPELDGPALLALLEATAATRPLTGRPRSR